MNHLNSNKPSFKRLRATKRKPVQLSQAGLIQTDCLPSNGALPLLVRPAVEGLNLVSWIACNPEFLKTHLVKHGGILFRDFNISSITEFERLIRTAFGELLEYVYGSTPRSQVSGKVYTSTEYPASQSIPLHNEMSYSRNWPMKIGFYCVTAPQQGGETPIADSRNVYQHLDPRLRERFIQKQVMYVRNYGDGLDLPWQQVFQTNNKAVVEAYCRQVGIEVEWKDRHHLRTRQICQAVATHPQTGESVWFNQAHLFHVSNLQPDVRDRLLAEFDQADLPRNTYYGDGSPIETAVLDEIRQVYQQETVTFPWQNGDILILDNMLAAHGRTPFVGPRRVVVGMAESMNNQNI